MNLNNFTIKSQEAIQKAIELTKASGQQQIEPLHILKALLQENETICNFIFETRRRTADPEAGHRQGNLHAA